MGELLHQMMPMPMGPWTARDAVLMLAMWVVMMAVMMLPSALPMLAAHHRVQRQQGGAPTGLFLLGYLLAWSGFALAATALQWALDRAALMANAMVLTNRALAGATLLLAGLYQWTPWKTACLGHCRSPLDFVLHHWREGWRGALAMGWAHGLYCLGCCWALMALLFVGGVMDWAWIAGLTVYVLLEKIVPPGHWLDRAAGLVLVLWGAAVLLSLAAAGSAG